MAKKKRRSYKRNTVEKWLIKNEEVINISALERILSIPKGTIQKFLREGKRINDERIDIINNWIYGHIEYPIEE